MCSVQWRPPPDYVGVWWQSQGAAKGTVTSHPPTQTLATQTLATQTLATQTLATLATQTLATLATLATQARLWPL